MRIQAFNPGTRQVVNYIQRQFFRDIGVSGLAGWNGMQEQVFVRGTGKKPLQAFCYFLAGQDGPPDFTGADDNRQNRLMCSL